MRVRALAVAITMIALACGSVARAELKVGDYAPDFELEGSDGETYKLSQMRGKHIVVAWFPKAFTGG